MESLRACGEAEYAANLQRYFGRLTFLYQNGSDFIYSSVSNGNYISIIGPTGTANDCQEIARNLGAKSCSAAGGGTMLGNPINIGSGNKFQAEVDYESGGTFGLAFRRYYNSGFPAGLVTSIGARWTHSFLRRLEAQGTGATRVRAIRADGEIIYFTACATGYCAGQDQTTKLTRFANAQNQTIRWELIDVYDTIETYDGGGRLLSEKSRAGVQHTLSYSNVGRLISVIDSFGRRIELGYDTAGRINSLTQPDTSTITLGYDTAGNLASVSYPDGVVKAYLYNEPGYVAAGAVTSLLTGIVDEAGVRFASFRYDASSRAIESQHANGAGRVQVAYDTSSTRTVTDALNTSRVYGIQTAEYVTYVSSVTGGPCSSCGLFASYGYNLAGDQTSRTDFKGAQSTSTFNARHLEEARVEAIGTSVARTRVTSWHPIYRIPTSIATYAGETGTGIPLRHESLTHYASGDIQSRTLTDFSVTPNATRTWTYTYDSYGRVLTENGPRTDVINDTTTYTYYACTTGFECGQLHTVQNALGHARTFLTYNAFGQPLTLTDENGVLTTLDYDQRGRLTSTTTAAESYVFTYWPTGLLQTISDPGGNVILYSYDDAHRLVRIDDSTGNHIEYDHDAQGNRIVTRGYDPQDILRRTQTRMFNALGQLWKDIPAANTATVTTVFGYDQNGNLTTTDAPLSRSSVAHYDELNRLDSITDAGGGVTHFAHDAADDLTSVSDPANLLTSYELNGFGELVIQTSPDTGLTQMTYDSGGNLASRTDARGAAIGRAVFTYDAANRLLTVTYPDQSIVYGYDVCPYGVGRVCSISDQSGTTSYEYDARGRVTKKTHASTNLFGAHVRSVRYSYSNGRLFQITMPSGVLVDYSYDLGGRVSHVTVTQPGSALLTVAANVQYDPFGAVKGWTWANGSTHSREIDADGRITQIVSAGIASYQYDDASRIQSINAVSGSPGPSRSFTYDALDRLTSQDGPSGQQQTLTYDANGNRLTQTGYRAATFAYPTSGGELTSNRLQSASGGVIRNYNYDAAGNVTTDAPGGYASMTLTYDGVGRLRHAGEDERRYNALGQRMYVVDGANDTSYMYDEAGRVIEICRHARLSICDPHRLQEVIWLEDIPLAVIFQESVQYDEDGFETAVIRAVFNVHTDHLNTPRRLTVATDPTDAIRWKWHPDAFGVGFEDGSPPSGSGFFVSLDLRFPGQLFDPTWRHYNYFRDYDPYTGRYLQSDPIGLAGGINTYAYVGGNPLSFSDSMGLAPPGRTVPSPSWFPPGPFHFPLNPSEWSANAASQIAEGVSNAVQAVKDAVCEDNKCRPCKTVSGRIVPVGTIAYRPLDVIPATEKQHGVYGSHHNIFKANQYPYPKCDCFWAKQNWAATPAELLPEWIPIEPFVN